MNKLKKFRLSKGISQEAMARSMGITLSYYSQVERGVANFSRAFVEKLKKAFPEIDVNDVFFNSERGA